MIALRKINRSTRKFVVRHRTAIAVGVTAAVLIHLNRKAIEDYDAFLVDGDLLNDFNTFLAEK